MARLALPRLAETPVETHFTLRPQYVAPSQAELARRAGLSRQALSAIEAGRYLPNTAVALRLAQALGTVEQGAGEAAGPGALAPPRPPR